MKSLYKNLAEDGIKRHKRLYYPFIGTTVFFIVLINLCLSISADPVIETFFWGNYNRNPYGSWFYNTIDICLTYDFTEL